LIVPRTRRSCLFDQHARITFLIQLTPDATPRELHPSPTRRSSDLDRMGAVDEHGEMIAADRLLALLARDMLRRNTGATVIADVLDRKSTRLNSSHVKTSYAVFCLKKKKKEAK